jgi:predicted DNA-binding protein with PD1-like motif
VEDHDIKAGTISGSGAVNEAILRFLDPTTKEFVDKTFNEHYLTLCKPKVFNKL